MYGQEISVNGFVLNDAGTWTAPDGTKVGTPAFSRCGCPGADTFHYSHDVRVCSRCVLPLD